MAATECYFIGLEKPDPVLFQQGLAWLIDNAAKSGGSAWIAVNQRESIGNIAKYPGFGRFAIFHKRGVNRTLLADCMIELVTRFSVPEDGRGRPMLVFHPTGDFLSALERVPNIQKILVIPFLAQEVDNWAKRNFAKDLDNPDLPSIYVDDIAITAFKHLRFAFTETPPQTPAQYRAALCQTLHILVQNGIRFEPQALQSALIQQCGWGPVSSKQVAELSEIFLVGQSPAGYDGRGPWEPDIMKLWKIEAAKTRAE
ncbi:hypothetical protein Ngar_c33090 [Candidatus Nitrososphaera gargensis Ga9.2]|uniref:Uncharacterized protein n=1 Tax=Nitrososphaera gargensis (strain Ga9.2) TaxID=1237085 RepID=K0INZ3_NITGG|nr:hypothetical protein [Candidatus Nitrososphaera gargensis]AFU60224.1 hypothetical protein Ngar_c33090 [Candidatus Nitrososphaera gargensis Ga9.2]